MDINELITCQTYNDGSITTERREHALSVHQWELEEFLNVCNFFQNELYQQYRIIYDLSDEMNEDLMNEEFVQLMELSCFEALYLYEVKICDTSNNDYWAFVIDINSTEMYINADYINITDFPSWYEYKQDYCDISSMYLDDTDNTDNLMTVLLCDLVNITIPPTTTTTTTTTQDMMTTKQCEDTAKIPKRFIFRIITSLADDNEFEDEMKNICKRSFRKALIAINNIWNDLWCFILSFFDFNPVSSSNRRLLQDDNDIEIEIQFTVNDDLQDFFISEEYDEDTFLSAFLDEIANEAKDYGLIDNETEVSGLMTISTTTTEKPVEQAGDDIDVMDTSQPYFWIILFGIIVILLICGLCLMYCRVRNIEKKQQRAMELSTLHISPSYHGSQSSPSNHSGNQNHTGNSTFSHIPLSASSPRSPKEGKNNTKKGIVPRHETYDTIDIADQIAEDLRRNKETPIVEPETDAEDSDDVDLL